MTSGALIIVGLLQAILIAVTAPLFSGFSRVLRAKMHSRHGPPLLQNYYDLFKLVKRQEIVPQAGNILFRATPYVIVAGVLLVAAIVPVLITQSPFGGVGDVILVIYVLAMVRFFTSLAS